MTKRKAGWLLLAALPLAGRSERHEVPDVAEAARIQHHLATVASELRARPPDHLSASQFRARAEVIAWLEEYTSNGVFPHNHVVLDGRTPIFVDPHGTPCAVGFLLLRSGESELVRDVVQADNLVRVPDLADEPRLQRWLQGRGLTLEEAARIQPAYGPAPPNPVPAERSTYAGVTVGMSVLTAAASAYSAFSEPGPESGPWLEMVTAAASLGHLAMVFVGNERDNGAEPTWSKNANAVGAVLAALVTVDRMRRRGAAQTPATSPVATFEDGRLGLGVTIRH